MIDVSQVSVRYTRIDREYETCLAELGNLLAEPQPGDTKKIPPGLLEPRRFLEELYSIVYDCIEQLIPLPNVIDVLGLLELGDYVLGTGTHCSE